MKSFEIKALGLEEMTSADACRVEGGSVVGGIIIGIIVGAVIDAILDPESALADFNRGRAAAREML